MDKDVHTYQIIGAAMTVHRELGCGFLENVYQEALSLELAARRIPFHREKIFPVYYRGRELESYYRADFVCYHDVIVEVKAQTELEILMRPRLSTISRRRAVCGESCSISGAGSYSSAASCSHAEFAPQ